MDLIENPTLDLNIKEICFPVRTVVLITFKSLKRNIGKGLPVPNGSKFFKSL